MNNPGYGSFQRTFNFGAPIDPTQVKANYHDGVVDITIP